MSAACGCDEPTTSPADEAEEAERPWWRDPGLVVPILSGVAFGTGLALEWSGLHIAALVAFWAGLLLGAYTFVPGAIRNLVVKRKLGIALLMTISAVGAVILGYVEEAAALAFLYSIAEALEDKAMDRARGGLRRENGQVFRDRLLARGSEQDPAQSFRDLLGRDPQIGPLLRCRGLVDDDAERDGAAGEGAEGTGADE